MTDCEIVKLFFERDEQAIRETDARYGRLCHSVAYNILEHNEDSKECVNDTYLALWSTIPPKVPESLKAYAVKITRNQALKRLEKQRAQKRDGVCVDIEELENLLPARDAQDEIDSQHLGRLINDFLLKEKKLHRQVFLRKYWYFDSVEEISVSLGCSQSKIKNILYRMRCKLKEFLEKEGFNV